MSTKEKPIIEIKGIGKKYNITHQRGGYIALRDVLAGIIKNPFKFAKHKAKQAVGLVTKEEFWALRNVNLEINKGDIVGIIGRNGAGKSTLLKILTGITPPTEGEIVMRGRVASLLEVGTGFHPELTGRENIFLNGAILGMTKKEIARKFDEIVAFAGIEKFLDTPVKYYSSGMYVRLAFSVAAHMEPDILLVDEVLAVGDADFQKKCLGKMEEVSKEAGRTILFVSHDLSAVKNLCKKSILLHKGRIEAFGETGAIVEQYLSSEQINNKAVYLFEKQGTPVSIDKVTMYDNEGHAVSDLPISSDFKITVEFSCEEKIQDAVLALIFYSADQEILLYSTNADTTGKYGTYEKGLYNATITIPAFLFNVDHYTFDVMLCTPKIAIFGAQKGLGFEVVNINNPRSINFRGKHLGKIALPLLYEINKN